MNGIASQTWERRSVVCILTISSLLRLLEEMRCSISIAFHAALQFARRLCQYEFVMY